MLDVIKHWYRQRFSDPGAVALFLLLLFGFVVVYFMGHILAPFFAAVVIAYLLEWPVSRLERLGLGRGLAAGVVLLLFAVVMVLSLVSIVPSFLVQTANLAREVPAMINRTQEALLTLPEQYPELVDVTLVQSVLDDLRGRLLGSADAILSVSISSLTNAAVLLVYLILVSVLVFFMLKDKRHLLDGMSRFLPRNRELVSRVWLEMNGQIANYVRGKVIEILIVGVVSYVTFALLDLRYALLLAVLVGFSVLIPYIGAAAATVPVAMVGLFQWGFTPPFFYLMVAYGIIQALDGNVLVPILFSEAVNLHPIAIIVAVLVFGGLWGFWGVFFAIPLATLVKAVLNAWPQHEDAPANTNN
ncbi:AI-2E family transporter [Zobellella denitrificans]|jgi:putative permease|uniref:Permease n=1 Tax=Zobellella denitrificans TaxID=347534 RepID=A0A231MZV4_9GAMM|nr:AI-2E family transporter [Zobellella denitrificans]ATG74714.1 permease [Zobellella denitrificans]OXS15771.1 AI-2E family transporter [Zobellella denitrificans]